MEFDDVAEAMREQPWGVTRDQGRQLYEFVLREKPEKILELGCGIGTSACYMSAALAKLGRGKITSIDRNPDLPEWIDRTFAKVPAALRQHHELILSETSYNDELMWLIEGQTRDGVCQPLYDFCFLDGAHTWEADACAFFLAEKLLKPGKWLLLDDLTWTLAGSGEAQKHMKSPVPLRLQKTQQVMQVLKFCVAQHPSFDSLSIEGDWGWARKNEGAAYGASAIRVARPSLSRRAIGKIGRAWRTMQRSR
jgi:predicted O-methyltransferase YrrM